jgi:EAL domain-containing protein (putative c-di-GMP-specific phosphodiesterase class I)
MATPIELSTGEVVLTPSIGIAPASTGKDAKSILRNADVAMYLAKSSSDRQYEVFEQAMHVETVRRIEVESELRAALTQHQFDVHLQPIVDLETEEPLGAEALVRWNHPERGIVYPGDFIDVAEETGLIVPIGTSVLRRACRVLAAWGRDERTSKLTMSVNLSAKQLRDPAIVDEVRHALEDSGAQPHLLTLEITESTMAEGVDETIERLTQLKQLGVRLAIDDFGTGYSSLSYLQNFPIDILKIDRSFISQLDSDTDGSSLARTIIGIGQSLHLTTVAEGVETRAQSDMLSELGCSRGQGYLFAKPMPADSFLAHVREWDASDSFSPVLS